MKILLVAPTTGLTAVISDILSRNRYQVVPALDGIETAACICAEQFDGVILDEELLKASEVDILTQIRKARPRTPVMIMVSSDVQVRELGSVLELSGSDCLTMPFTAEELLERVKSLVLKQKSLPSDVLAFGDIKLDTHRCELKRFEEVISLPKLECQLLETLIRNEGIYLLPEELLVKVWGKDACADFNSVWVYIHMLRKRLRALGSSVTIETKRNVGYTIAK